MIEVEFHNGNKINVPQHFGELRQEAFIQAMKVTSCESSLDEVKMELLPLIMPIKVENLDLTDDNVMSGYLQLLGCCDAFFTEDLENGVWNRKLSFPDFPIKTIDVDTKLTLRCPGNMLNKLNFGQYKNVISIIKMIQKNPNEEVLFRVLGAALFLEVQDPSLYSDVFKNVDIWVFYSLYWCTAANLDYLSSNKINIDGEFLNFSELFNMNDSDKGKYTHKLGLNRVLFQLAESSVFASIKDVEETPYLQVFLRLLDLTERTYDSK